MGRELRFVTDDWEPHDEPLLDGLRYPDDLAEWEEGKEKWEAGLIRDHANGGWKPRPEAFDAWEEYAGPRPDPDDYTSVRPWDHITQIVMYETTSEGTPISPPFPIGDEGEEALAEWLAENEASAFCSMTATKEQWLSTIRRRYAPTAVAVGDGPLKSGVEGLSGGES